MPDTNALTYLQLQDAVLGRRFPAAQRANAKRWIQAAYQDVWAAADWTFVRVSQESLVVADATPTMPATFAEALGLWDEQGSKLERLSQEEFEEYAVSPFVGQPFVYAVVNRQIMVAPTPGGSVTFKLSYKRRLSHKDSDGITVAAGFMDDATDYPLWDDHHSLLIPRAQAIGLNEINDPTGPQQQEEYERQLSRMKDDYEHVQPQTQWAKTCWDG